MLKEAAERRPFLVYMVFIEARQHFEMAVLILYFCVFSIINNGFWAFERAFPCNLFARRKRAKRISGTIPNAKPGKLETGTVNTVT